MSERPDYLFDSVGAALRRFFYLHLDLQSAGSMPINEDDLINPTKVSGDTMIMLEWLDLSRLVGALSLDEQVCLYLEFTEPTMPVVLDKRRKGRSKVGEVYRLCGRRMNMAVYEKTTKRAMDTVQRQMEIRGWIQIHSSCDAPTGSPRRR